MIPAAEVRIAGVVGAGSVGAAWASLMLARGIDVVAHDPGPGAEARARRFLETAWPHVGAGTGQAEAPQARLRFVDSAAQVAREAQFVLENVPEKPQAKADALAELDAAATPDKVIGSSTGGFPPSELQKACRLHPERMVVIHPFNPAHLVPLVEVVPGSATSPEVVEWAMVFCRRLGKHPIRILREATGHMANRLQFALLREAVHCLLEGYASAEDIDAAVREGLGPRWALMGSLLTLHLAGGPKGMQGIMDHAGDAMDSWWAALGTPRMTPEVRSRMIAAAAEVSRGRSAEEWERWRDERLAALLQLRRDKEKP